MNSNLVYKSTDISIFAQLITGLIGVDGIFKKLEPQYKILQSVLGLELVVQIIELVVYVFIIRYLSVKYMAQVRYYDWIVTTPTMLFTTIIYYKYEEYKQKLENSQNNKDEKNVLFYKNKLENLNLTNFINENKLNISLIFICNFLMLLFGYLGEIKVGDIYYSAFFGFIFFIATFYIIYDNYAKYSTTGNNMFVFFFFVWSLYGIAYLFNPVYKNITFNGLDLVAKNFFGLYLYYKITQVSS